MLRRKTKKKRLCLAPKTAAIVTLFTLVIQQGLLLLLFVVLNQSCFVPNVRGKEKRKEGPPFSFGNQVRKSPSAF